MVNRGNECGSRKCPANASGACVGNRDRRRRCTKWTPKPETTETKKGKEAGG